MKQTDHDMELRKLMKKISLEKPSPLFSERVMSAVMAETVVKPAMKHAPVLGRSFWIFTGMFILLMGLMVIIQDSGQTDGVSLAAGILERFPAPDLSSVREGYSRFWDALTGIPVTLAAIMAAASALMLADKYFTADRKVSL